MIVGVHAVQVLESVVGRVQVVMVNFIFRWDSRTGSVYPNHVGDRDDNKLRRTVKSNKPVVVMVGLVEVMLSTGVGKDGTQELFPGTIFPRLAKRGPRDSSRLKANVISPSIEQPDDVFMR